MFLRLDVAQLSRDEMLQMIRDYQYLEQYDDSIDESSLRTFAREIRKRNGYGSIGITVLMRDIIFEVYRRLAMENIRDEI